MNIQVTYVASTFISSVRIATTSRSLWGAILELITTASLGLDGSLEGGGDNLRGQVQVLAQVVDAFIGQVPVVVAPAELLLHVALRLERLQGTDDKEIGDLAEGRVETLRVKVLLCHHDALLEEVLKDGQAVLDGHKHVAGF